MSITEVGDYTKGYKSSGGTYTYDASGNMTKTPTIQSITYNHLNLPEIFDIDGTKQIETIYDASGYKWQKKVTGGNSNENYTIDYISGGELSDKSGQIRIEAIHHSEGRIAWNDLVQDYRNEYVIRDHLGNTRIAFSDIDEDGSISTSVGMVEVVQTSDFYPFGLTMDLQNPIQTSDNKYLYNGKELNTDFDLNWMDYGARWYDASVFGGFHLSIRWRMLQRT